MPDAVQIGLLLGAGPKLSGKTRAKLRSLMEETFAAVQAQFAAPLASDEDLLLLADLVTRKLEDSELTNAGRGSELTIDGNVECDATMALLSEESGDLIASCGAVPDLVNPIELCTRLLRLRLDPAERARAVPNFLVGDAAREYGLRLGLRIGNTATARAQQTREKYLDATNFTLDRYLDTVGVIIMFKEKICVCSSSGGPILKDPGRIGPAALFGCGSYASATSAAVCSGFGEDITATRLAQVAVETDQDLAEVLSGPWRQRLQRTPPYFGAIKMTTEPFPAKRVAFEWQHTTEGMVCGCARVTATRIEDHYMLSTEPQGGGLHL